MVELTVSLNYLPKVIAEGQRVPSSRFVATDGIKAKAESDFWEENRKRFRSTIVNNLDICEWMEMFEQVIDENVIVPSTLECIAFNTHFNNDTYEVNFDITFKFDVIDEEQFFIQSNRMKTLLCNYLNEHRGFIDTGDNGIWVTDNEMCVRYDVEVFVDDLNVEFETRKQECNMELKLTVSYQPRITTNPVRYNSKMQNVLTDAEKFTYDAEFWNAYRDKFYLESGLLQDSFTWHIYRLIEPVIDTDIIDVNSCEVLSFDSKFDKNTYAVQFEVILHFDSLEHIDSDELCIHKNRLADLITNWLIDDGIYDNDAFISAEDDDLNATFGNVTVYYKIEVEREDVDVSIEVRK